MTADPEPFDVRLARLDLRAVAEGGAAVARVGHLPNVLCALHPLDPKRIGRLAALAQGLDQFLDCRLKRAPLLARHPRELAGEARRQP